MRILILNTLYAPYQVGGAEMSTQLLAEGLSRKEHRVTVACTSPEDELETRVVNGVPVYDVPPKECVLAVRRTENAITEDPLACTEHVQSMDAEGLGANPRR